MALPILPEPVIPFVSKRGFLRGEGPGVSVHRFTSDLPQTDASDAGRGTGEIGIDHFG